MRCGVCSRHVRKTSLARVLPDDDVYRVCDECKRLGITLIARPATTPSTTSTRLTENERTIRTVLRALASQYRGLAEAYASPKQHEDGTVGAAVAVADALARWTAFTQAAEVATAWAERVNIRTENDSDEKEVPHG